MQVQKCTFTGKLQGSIEVHRMELLGHSGVTENFHKKLTHKKRYEIYMKISPMNRGE